MVLVSKLFDSLNALPELSTEKENFNPSPVSHFPGYRIPRSPIVLSLDAVTTLYGGTAGFKTTVLIDLTRKMIEDQKNILFVSFEESTEDLGLKFLSSFTSVKMRTLTNSNYDLAGAVSVAQNKFSGLKLLGSNHFGPRVDVQDFLARVDEARSKGFKIDVLVIDDVNSLSQFLGDQNVIFDELAKWSMSNGVSVLASGQLLRGNAIPEVMGNKYVLSKERTEFQRLSSPNSGTKTFIEVGKERYEAYVFPETIQVLFLDYEVSYPNRGFVIRRDEFGSEWTKKSPTFLQLSEKVDYVVILHEDDSFVIGKTRQIGNDPALVRYANSLIKRKRSS